MQRSSIVPLLIVLLVSSAAAAKPAQPMQIYFIDVEGGQSTLLVSPSGQSILIDTGWAGGRDADRILSAAKAAAIKRIDYVVITHYHQDHVGGVRDLAGRIKIGAFVDHGASNEDSDSVRQEYAIYKKTAAHAVRLVVKSGQGLPMKGIELEFLAAAGEHITDPLPAAGEANPYCNSGGVSPADASENSQSLGMLITFGKFKFLDLGDLVEKKQLEMVCPNNLLGTVSLYLTTHHGVNPDNPKSVVWAIHPLVAIMNNGTHKGGSPEAWQIVHDSPGLADLWQLHYAADGGKDHNVAGDFIANIDEQSDGHYIKVTAEASGKFSVTNSRNGYTRNYP